MRKEWRKERRRDSAAGGGDAVLCSVLGAGQK